MVRKEDCTHIDQAMKAYAEKHGFKGIKIDYEHTKITEYDGVIHFTHEVSIPEKSKTDDAFEEFEKVLARN
jgi:hypothetical protein